MNDKHLKKKILLILKKKNNFTIKRVCYIHEAYSFYCEINLVFQNHEKMDFKILFIHLNGTTLKTLLLQILITKIIFFKQNRWYTFCCLYLWAKYEPIWTDFNGQTVILRANMNVQAHTIPQNAKCSLFFYPKLRLLKIIKF